MAELTARSDKDSVQPPLSQAVGYIVVVVIGLIIAFPMMLITKVLKKTTGEDNKKTEMFMTANRTVRTGLTASAVISSWLWTTAMLGSSFVGYDYGVAGPFWFAAGCSPMIVFFALIGISCKRKIPEAHTSLEVVRIRYGRTAHIVFMTLCLVNNIFACANMLLGAAAVISAVTGMHIIAATFLLPVGVTVYTFVGGIKATFLTDYFHTAIILIIACYFSIKTFTFDEVGSIGKLYDLVQAAAQRHPVSGNHDGTYLTMTSKGAMLFGILHICSNFGLVIMDTSYFIKAFSAAPSSVVPGYTIGGIAYFAIPWALGTIMSSVAIGLENQPSFPTYPRRMTTREVSGGLVLPYAAMTIAGKGGAAAILLITFMAVTSTLSAQVIAVSSILSFDVYREYFNRNASDRDIIRSSHFGVIFFAAFSAGFSTMLHYVGIDLGWTLYMLGVVTCPGIFPMAFTILWRRQSTAAAILSPVLGMATGIGVWLGTAQHFYGSVSVSATGQILPCVYGTVASAFSPILYSVVITLVRPQNYDWNDFKKEKLALERLESDLTTVHSHQKGARQESTLEEGGRYTSAFDPQELKRWGRIAAFWSIATFLGHWVIWPLPMYGSKYVFGKGFFSAWVIVAIIWLWLTMLVAILYPIFDGGIQQIKQIYRGVRSSNGTKEAIGHETSLSPSIRDTAEEIKREDRT
ncbi:Sodium:solute symporter family-domain-containing protein [Aspergillus pseudotamarii]|uniref:Sodium:solute symporter family-domain-containing protein n=1 Tax=Aspergillus pseudotamarii TaxID=132259 RepID=A0A5N6ST19_ASPPS|nr:Sodium:solute symporter family-domain-containing protein [Aspergillus pseudotamarii]KAE8137772.1 Sodium:solute symporter family-domain-containing protein [Aspergillus pseudotamarii]